MTPDTSAYMIAGFAVIFGGILFYVLSIFARTRRARQLLDSLAAMSENQTQDTNAKKGKP